MGKKDTLLPEATNHDKLFGETLSTLVRLGMTTTNPVEVCLQLAASLHASLAFCEKGDLPQANLRATIIHVLQAKGPSPRTQEPFP